MSATKPARFWRCCARDAIAFLCVCACVRHSLIRPAAYSERTWPLWEFFGGNHVDGLPPAPSLCNEGTKLEIFRMKAVSCWFKTVIGIIICVVFKISDNIILPAEHFRLMKRVLIKVKTKIRFIWMIFNSYYFLKYFQWLSSKFFRRKQSHGLPPAQVMQRRHKTWIFSERYLWLKVMTRMWSHDYHLDCFCIKIIATCQPTISGHCWNACWSRKNRCRYFWFWEFVRLVLDVNRCRALPVETSSMIYRRRQVIPNIIKAILCQLNNDLSEIWNGWSKCLFSFDVGVF